jgi:ribose-phosphate pyrophosphokinase
MTGALSGFEVYADDLTGKEVVILDDICDGGGTFIGLTKKLREKGAAKVTLYVTHGMFTKGVKILLESIDEVWCYSYHGPSEDSHLVNQVELFLE